MKIAYVVDDPGIGIFGTKGASVHAQEMIRALRTLGHQVSVYCTKRGDRADQPDTEHMPADLADLPVYVVPVASDKTAAAREQAIARASDRMAGLICSNGADLVYERYALFSTAAAQVKRLHPGTPVVLEVNAPLLQEQSTYRSLHDTQGAQQATIESLVAADLISCVSAPVSSWVHRSIDHAGDTPPRVIVTPNGVNTDRFQPANHHQDRPLRIGFLGTLKPWHGTDLLLKAFAQTATQHPEWRLHIVGRGPQREQLAESAIDLGISEQVVFHGAVPPSQVPGLLSTLDIAVAPYPEPSDPAEHYFSPLKVYEYMAAGLAIIASRIGELPTLLDGRGVLVPPSDTSALAQALGDLAADPQRRAQLGAAARQAATDQHTWLHRADHLLAVLAEPDPIPARQVV